MADIVSRHPARHHTDRATDDGVSEAQCRCGRRATWLAALLPTLVAAVVFVLYFQAQPHWLADPDAQDYAQLGRQIAAGRGPTTRYMPWNGLDFLTQRGGSGARGDASGDAVPTWPNIVRFPLTPLLMALGFAAFGAGDEAAHLPAGLAFVLTAGCAGMLAARVFGTWAGLTAGITAAFLPLLVNYSLTGLTEPLLGLLILGVLVCVVGRPSPPGRLVLGGVLFGLAILNRYDTALLALPILGLWLLPRPDRLRATVLFLGPALVFVLPWAAYLTAVAGAPLFNVQPASIAAQASGRSDGLGWYLPEYVSPAEVWSRDPARALGTVWEELAATPNHLRKLVGWPWLLAGGAACLLSIGRSAASGLAPAGAARSAPTGSVGALRAAPVGVSAVPVPDAAALVIFLLMAVLLRAVLASTLGLNLQRHFVPLVPLVLVVVAGEAAWLARVLIGWLTRGAALRRVLLVPAQATIALLLIVPGLLTIWPFLVPPAQPPGPPTRTGEVEARPANLARLAEIVGPNQVVASNVPWSVAWQADRRAVPLPPTVEATRDLERRFGTSVDAIYVAGQVAIADAPRSWRAWDELRRRGTPPPGYMLAESFQNGSRLFVKQR
jgi:hypothetical protein